MAAMLVERGNAKRDKDYDKADRLRNEMQGRAPPLLVAAISRSTRRRVSAYPTAPNLPLPWFTCCHFDAMNLENMVLRVLQVWA